jgi:hypothetical protein
VTRSSTPWDKERAAQALESHVGGRGDIVIGVECPTMRDLISLLRSETPRVGTIGHVHPEIEIGRALATALSTDKQDEGRCDICKAEIDEFNAGVEAWRAGVAFHDLPDMPMDQNGVGWVWAAWNGKTFAPSHVAAIGEVVGHETFGRALVYWYDEGLRPIGMKLYAAPVTESATKRWKHGLAFYCRMNEAGSLQECASQCSECALHG